MGRKPKRRSEEWVPPVPEDSPSAVGEESEDASPLAQLDAMALREALGSLTVQELRSQAKAWSVNLQGKRRKSDLIDLLVSAKRGETEASSLEDPPELVLEDISPSSDPPFGQLEDLWIEAANRLDRGDYRAAIALSRDGLNLVGEWTRRYMDGACTRALLAARKLADHYGNNESTRVFRATIGEAQKAFNGGNLLQCSRQIRELQRLTAQLHMEEVGHVQDLLGERESALRELGGLRIDLSEAQDLLTQADGAATLGDREKATGLIRQFDRTVEKLRARRIEELRDYLSAVESRIEETEALGPSMTGPRKLVQQAWTALERNELVLCEEVARRCETAVLEVQRDHIDRAMAMRREYFSQVRELVARLKPTLKEANAYGIDIEEPKALLRGALDLFRRSEYLGALAKAEAAKRAVDALLPRVIERRTGHGVEKPTVGVCRACNSERVAFHDDGWASCRACGHRFRWRKEFPRLLAMLRERLKR
ncbi:MAG: hypothetical protein ACE5KQ_01075 [Thermoplasmata archaeon]